MRESLDPRDDASWQQEGRGCAATPWYAGAARAEYEYAARQAGGRGYDRGIPWQQWSDLAGPGTATPHGMQFAAHGPAGWQGASWGPPSEPMAAQGGWVGQQPAGMPQQALGFPGAPLSSGWAAHPHAPFAAGYPQFPRDAFVNAGQSGYGPIPPYAAAQRHAAFAAAPGPMGFVPPAFAAHAPWTPTPFPTEPAFGGPAQFAGPAASGPQFATAAFRTPRADRPFAGVAPKGYVRSDARIREDVCDTIMQDGTVDVSDVEVACASGEVTLTGTVPDRWSKRQLEQLVEACLGVRDVRNNLRFQRGDVASDETTRTPRASNLAGPGRSPRS